MAANSGTGAKAATVAKAATAAKAETAAKAVSLRSGKLCKLCMGLLVPTNKFLFVNLLGDDVTDLGVILGVYLVILLAYFGCYMILCITPK